MADMNIVDRRPNPKGKSLVNRQRFLEQARVEVKKAVADALKKRKVGDTGGENVTIPTTGGISEPIWHHNRRTGRTHHVVPGNKEYVKGDEIPRPTGGAGQGGREGSPDGSGGTDAFEFTLSKDEFLDFFFEDLELPDLVKKDLKDATVFERQRAGYTTDGAPANLSIVRTTKQAMARRIGLKRPKRSEIEALEKERAEAEARGDTAEVERLAREIERLERRRKAIGYIDPIDTRYRAHIRVPKPATSAVMFCLMDVSGSMTEAMKDLAKRFFMLLHVFLLRRYPRVDVVFIRHTSTAEVVNEETFFYSRETGGTVVSTALEKMLEVQREGSAATGVKQGPYSTDQWNIYVAQASDGDNYGADSGKCESLLEGEVLPLCQYYAYIEAGDGVALSSLSRKSDLWRAYEGVAARHKHFQMRRIGQPADVFAVFSELFKKGGSHA